MKAFKFSLDKVLGYREQVLESEKNALSFELAKETELIQLIEKTKGDIDEQSTLLKQRMEQGTTAIEIMQFSSQVEALKHKLKQQKSDLVKQQQMVQKQRTVVIKANQDHTLLQKLKEKKRAEYDGMMLKHESGILEEHITNAANRAEII